MRPHSGQLTAAGGVSSGWPFTVACGARLQGRKARGTEVCVVYTATYTAENPTPISCTYKQKIKGKQSPGMGRAIAEVRSM